MTLFTALLSGLIFGLGLLLSGMASPAKVLGFLDLAGAWDPSLALVMAGAMAVGLIAFGVAGQRSRSLLDQPMQLPSTRQIDRRLVGGSVLFGIGWGLAGFCPGPALVGLGLGSGPALLFVAAMLVGMKLFDWLERRQATARVAAATASVAQADGPGH
ncbi:DUF6691 family protein [Roseateles terrae]|uniref:YeeE/YedE family protein n=1 Tax=Roseateles terrae TaxID=431060 RepID=A0ABR6GRZ1_9BURK|nr:DUF6691 family protein [Roseateles terrae]MBB3194887.1 hypothetical protein [Roseateles terrae]OWQ85855.1 transporter [Roseateles terrae]